MDLPLPNKITDFGELFRGDACTVSRHLADPTLDIGEIDVPLKRPTYGVDVSPSAVKLGTQIVVAIIPVFLEESNGLGRKRLAAIQTFFALGRIFSGLVERLEVLFSRLDEASPFFFQQPRYRQSSKRFLRCLFVLLLGFLQALKASLRISARRSVRRPTNDFTSASRCCSHGLCELQLCGRIRRLQCLDLGFQRRNFLLSPRRSPC